MGDRNNPIKFGPEWLRNLARERSAAGSSSQNQANTNAGNSGSTESGASGGNGGAGGRTTCGSPCGVSSTSGGASAALNAAAANSLNSTGATAKIQLAKQRYGREEMLALYDRTSEAPPELKYIDFLYQPRGKPPFALNNTFEDEMENGPPPERFVIGRGLGRGTQVADRGRPRMSFVRTPSTGRGNHWPSWHIGGGNPRMAFNPEDEPPQRSWGTSNGGGGPTNRNSSGDQPDWTTNKLYRSSKRQILATNWRQSREEGEEWRSASDAAAAATSGRTRTNQDKWAERDWGDRPTSDKNQNRNNRRTWVGSEMQCNDDLPEWAVDNAEACGGTFDASGAFHGYSNDDSNVPKAQEPYPLTRSHTHGSFARSKTMEEGSEEWWASEKAKKLSPKRFDASDIKFKQPPPVIQDSKSADSSSVSHSIDDDLLDSDEKIECAVPDTPEANIVTSDEDKYKKKPKFSESNTFDSLMRSNINADEATDDRGNFQSVMITPNNSLRQKHQNIVASATDTSTRMQTHRSPGLLKLLGSSSSNKFGDTDYDNTEEKIVEDLIDMTLEDKEIIQITKPPTSSTSQMMNPPNSVMSTGMPPPVNAMPQMPNTRMQIRMSSPIHSNQSMMSKSNLPAGLQGPGMQTGMQQVGITNSALNASLGLPRPLGVCSMNTSMGMRMQGMPPHMMPNLGMSNPGLSNPAMGNPGMNNPGMTNPGMNNSGMGGSGMPAGMGPTGMQSNNAGISDFQNAGGLASMTSSNMTNNSLFMTQNTNNSSMQNHPNQANMFPMHGLQHSGSQASFASIYNNMMQTPPLPPPTTQNQAEMWYYEDPKKTIQGPFSSKEMFNWYRAGFFTQNLMVRRACDTTMRPLGSYGPVVPFAQMDILSSFPMPTNYEPRSQGPHDSILNSQSGLGLESVMNTKDKPPMEQFGTVQVIRNAQFVHAPPPPMVDSLWSSSTPAPDMMWVQQAMNARNDNHVNNLPIYFWEEQPTTIAPNTLLPEDITKEMKTEDQILAQIRAAQTITTQPNMSFLSEPPPSIPVPTKAEEVFIVQDKVTPNLDELQKLLQKDIMPPKPAASEASVQSKEPEEIFQSKSEKNVKAEPGSEPVKAQQVQKVPESKAIKQAKNESEKVKAKEATIKVKAKKTKEDKKEEELKKEEDIAKPDRRSVESSPIKNKKEEKNNKKELDKEKKEWLKEGFTIVKGPEKINNKETKKKIDEAKANEDAERKKKEEEKLAAEEERKKKQLEVIKKQQELQQAQLQRQATESVIKKAPWSAVANQTMQATSKEGLTLAEIQRLEREKKLEQIKEQQQMMQIIAQQQAAALAREQEMQAGLGWAKKKANNLNNSMGQSLAEIQAETRKQAAAAVAQVIDEPPVPVPQLNHAPWAAPHNGAAGGFWDTQPNSLPKTSEKTQEPPKTDANKNKKKLTLATSSKKETSPAAEFDTWCTTVLASWSSKIDVPTFVGFLKDIESPYEVKDYVKCYLGETKDSSDFARHFLERRSKLLRVGMVTPSDDLCSPAIAVNPRTISGSDYQEVKGKGKKTKKNKMLKVDARILGFSVTAAEDRINVGDIDTV